MAKEKSRKNVIGSVVSTVILILVILLALYIIMCRVKNKLPSFFGYSVVTIISESMKDTIPANTYILIKQTPASEIKEKDIITFYSIDPKILGALNTHRVVGIEQNGDKYEFTTRGDNNLADDEYKVTEEKLVGRYVRTLGIMTAVLVFLSNKFVLVGLILLACVTGAVWLALKPKKEKE